MDTLVRFKKPLLIIAGILVAVELAWGAYTLTRPVATAPQSTPAQSDQTAPSVTQSLGSVSLKGPSQAKVGDSVRVDIELASTSTTDGADLIIRYDPLALDLVPSGTNAAAAGTIYQDYPANSAENGVITLSGVSLSSGFSGSGIFGTLNFTAKGPGKTKVSLDFTPGSTTDSNITESSTGHDILKVVNSLEVTITN